MGRPVLPAVLSLAAMLAVCLAGCGGGGGYGNPPPPPISVTVSPATASVPLGGTQQFNAMVSNTSNTGVTWSVNGVTGGNAMFGTITAAGLYTAPQNLPSPAGVTIRATSAAYGSSSGSATLTVTSDVMVSVMPGAANVELGATLQLTGAVTGSGNPNTALNWSVNGVAGGNATVGTISASGLYTAPQILPAPAAVTVTGTSQADPAKSATTTLTATSTFTIAVSGPSAVDTAAMATFTATITPAPMSNPDTAVNWSVDNIPGGDPNTVGSINAAGVYTAPLVAPLQPTVTITATSVADPAKSASQVVTINTALGITITPSPSLNLELETSQQFTAVVSGTLNQNVVWDVNGIVGGNLTVGTINTTSNPATYTAPVNMPGVPVTVRAVSQFGSSFTASTSVTFFSNISVGITPSGATRALGRIQTLSASIMNTSNSNVEWRVNGVLGGDTANGRICVAGFLPCTQVTSPMAAGPVDYHAPASLPLINPVVITASSEADPSKSGASVVDVVANVSVSVTPASVPVLVNGNVLFTASVTGSPDQSISNWSVTGAGCSGALCGTITPQSPTTASYNAPNMLPSPNTVTITATSNDGMQTGSAIVTIVSTLVSGLLPASVTAGAQSSFTLRVRGLGFTLGPPSASVLINDIARATSCSPFVDNNLPSTEECTVTIDAADVAAAGNVMVQVQNPGMPAPQPSNAVNLVVVAEDASEDVIALTAGAPAAGNKDIAAVEASTVGSAPQADVTLVGIFSGGICNLQSSPAAITRPAGVGSVDICLFGSGLTGAASESYTLSGPGDITVTSVVPGGFVRLTLTFAANAQAGLRTIFVKTGNKDKASASGAIEVK